MDPLFWWCPFCSSGLNLSVILSPNTHSLSRLLLSLKSQFKREGQSQENKCEEYYEGDIPSISCCSVGWQSLTSSTLTEKASIRTLCAFKLRLKWVSIGWVNVLKCEEGRPRAPHLQTLWSRRKYGLCRTEMHMASSWDDVSLQEDSSLMTRV